MIRWLFEDAKTKQRKVDRAQVVQAALDSGEALEAAAKGTMNLAQDVTVSLQAKIDDYANQIEQTAGLLSDALLIVDSQGIIESINKAAEKMFGWKRRKIIGKELSVIFAFPDDTVVDGPFMENLLLTVNEEDQSAAVNHEEFMGICLDMKRIYIDVSASKVTNSNKKTTYIVLVRDVTHKVNNNKMIRELAERNHELITAIDASKTGFLVLETETENDDDEPKIRFANEGFRRFVGKPRKELLGANLRTILGVDKGYWTVRRSLTEKTEARHEIQLTDSTGKPCWYEVQITPVFRSKIVDRWILVFYETTELKQAYRDLHKSEAHFRAFGEASSESMFVHDYAELLNWNERLLNLTGYNEAELEKLNPLDFVHPLERETVRLLVSEKNAECYETLFLTKQGEVREVAINSRPISWDNAEARIVVARDITEFKDVETQLKKSRERYRTVIDNTIDMIVCFDKNLDITFTNQTFRDYYEVEIDDLIGISLLEIIPESDHDKFKEYMIGIVPGKAVHRAIHRIKRHDEIRWQDWIDRGIFNNEDELIEIQSVARDITHLLPNQ